MKQRMYQNRSNLNILATRVTMNILRCFYNSPRRSLGVSDLARRIGTSRASVYRRVDGLVELGILRVSGTSSRKRYRIDITSPIAEPLYEMFNYESLLDVRPRVRTVLELLMSQVQKETIVAVILFGSHARGIATDESDVDLCIVHTGGPSVKPLDLGIDIVEHLFDARIDPHIYTLEAFNTIPNLAVLDAIQRGISLLGHVYLFEKRFSTESITKESLLGRLESSRENLERSRKVIGAAKEHFESMVEVALSEIESVLDNGTTVPKRGLRPKGRFERRLTQLESRLAQMGEVIWLE